jgi:SAM-dependent methyltransferase
VQILDAVKAHTPWTIRNFTRRIKREIHWARNARLPARKVFKAIYDENAWGGHNDGEYYSGPGSDSGPAHAYADRIRRFVTDHHIASIVDLGCGDFRVGSMLVSENVRYVGVDIVDDLVRVNRRRFGKENIQFQCLDITRDTLPDGDLCLVREVFQHLSNTEILRVLPRLRNYRYVIYTDYQPPPSALTLPNRDIAHGRDTRLWKGSALFLDQPPFNIEMELLFETRVSRYICSPGERISTYIIRP